MLSLPATTTRADAAATVAAAAAAAAMKQAGFGQRAKGGADAAHRLHQEGPKGGQGTGDGGEYSIVRCWVKFVDLLMYILVYGD